MPEGPEVTIITQYLDQTIKNAEIIEFNVLSGRYTHQELVGYRDIKFPAKITKIDSKGKFMWFELALTGTNKTAYLMNTLGLTGEWNFEQSEQNRIHIKLQKNGNDINLFYDDPRNFGTLAITTDKKKLDKKLNKLAPDILKSQMSDENVALLITNFINLPHNKKKNINIVNVLMNDQSAIVSGIGNYLVAEILYDAKISPFRDISDLSEKEILILAHSMRKIVKSAYYDNTTGYMKKIENFVKKHKEGIINGIFPNYHPDIGISGKFKFRVYKRNADFIGNFVQTDQVIKGRTIYWVPNVQK